jgi:hypothetical protein
MQAREQAASPLMTELLSSAAIHGLGNHTNIMHASEAAETIREGFEESGWACVTRPIIEAAHVPIVSTMKRTPIPSVARLSRDKFEAKLSASSRLNAKDNKSSWPNIGAKSDWYTTFNSIVNNANPRYGECEYSHTMSVILPTGKETLRKTKRHDQTLKKGDDTTDHR